jgi:hypothetical protein
MICSSRSDCDQHDPRAGVAAAAGNHRSGSSGRADATLPTCINDLHNRAIDSAPIAPMIIGSPNALMILPMDHHGSDADDDDGDDDMQHADANDGDGDDDDDDRDHDNIDRDLLQDGGGGGNVDMIALDMNGHNSTSIMSMMNAANDAAAMSYNDNSSASIRNEYCDPDHGVGDDEEYIDHDHQPNMNSSMAVRDDDDDEDEDDDDGGGDDDFHDGDGDGDNDGGDDDDDNNDDDGDDDDDENGTSFYTM